jgi:transcriptional regulator with XRE-family HTH domain
MARARRSSPTRTSPMPEIARIGEAFARRRIELRLTQQAVADLAGVSRSSVQSLEYGTGSTKLASVVEIAEVLGLALEPMSAADAEARR